MAPPAREHLLARGKWAERSNAFLAKAWEKGWLPPPDLDPESIWAAAAKPYGDAARQYESGGRGSPEVIDFRTRLERLTKAIAEEANLNALGQAMAFGQLTRTISTRLALGRYWLQNPPDPRGFEMAAPIIVLGQMRSGTTRIHKLLAADPAHAHTRYQDSYHPAPATMGIARAKAKFDIAMLSLINPWLQTIHPVAASEVEEELGWLGSALNHSIYEAQWHIPGYSAWSEARDPWPVYIEFARILRSDAKRRGNAMMPRILKVPQFAEDLETLLSVFPQARLVIAERDHEAVLRSSISMAANQMAIQSDSCDLVQIEAFWRRKISLREERLKAALANWNGPVARLSFDALNRDWESEIARTYSELGLTFSGNALIAMRDLMERSSAGQHHSHSEQLARFKSGA